MPPKTREQKILARLHRLQRLRTQSETPSPKIEKEITVPVLKTTSPTENLIDYSYVYKDLRKILILSSLAIILEFVLSLTSTFSFVKLILRIFNI